MADERVPTTSEELVPVLQQELEVLARAAFGVAGTCEPWPDPVSEERKFDDRVEMFGRRLAEAVAARPRPVACESWTVVVDIHKVEAGDETKIANLGDAPRYSSSAPDGRATVLFLPMLALSSKEDVWLQELRDRRGKIGSFAASVSVVMGMDLAANERIVAVTRMSPRGSGRWWSSGTMAADRTAKLGPWSDKDPPTPAGAPTAVKVTSVGSSMLN